MLLKKLKALFHPERYHGWGMSSQYFEGWYYKIISADEQHALAFIPGIAMDDEGHKHAFIQVLNGKTCEAEYITFKAEDFVSQAHRFKTEIEDNVFEGDQISLNLPNVKGQLQFSNTVPWPNSWCSPGIMGPYAFVPFMQCYHGILSMDHSIYGQLTINGTEIDFTGGRGYTEKDWGRSFPSAYIWMQCNHFGQAGISLKMSMANIPWLRSSFVGFIVGLYYEDRLIQFTTYNSTVLTKCLVDKNVVQVELRNKKYQLQIVAQRSEATELASPINGFMDGRISESMTSTVDICLKTKNGDVLLRETGRNVGLEVAGKVEQIVT
ncbi:tocopherol cyclase family protein [Carboxylicivirga sp. M1479]|uniref:tocopherol cyclase family protein n=1 Tax=Carboxylicivirga sp. M1479 TaxID=2594476 RepID=UPI0011788D02|nr:tocopherol cyclase family protein [Carboxylicivirga sp. M1479]TRX65816.1 hypothetical protein FNN09_17085 [Carboxylicivirga sp. M1479]